jgi:hypothetical protein
MVFILILHFEDLILMHLQRNPKLSCVFASSAPLLDVPGILVKMQPLKPDVQGEIFAEIVLPPEMVARRPMAAIDWKDTCAGHSGCSPLAPLLQGYARSSTSMQVLNQTAAALSWIRFLTSQTINLSAADSSHSDTLIGLLYYHVVLSTATHDPLEHFLTIKVQVNGSRYTSVPQNITLTPGACEHVFRIGMDEALGRFVALVSVYCDFAS